MCQLNLAALTIELALVVCRQSMLNGALVRLEKAEPVLAPDINVALCVAIAEVFTGSRRLIENRSLLIIQRPPNPA
jgi:hypothetical protein